MLSIEEQEAKRKEQYKKFFVPLYITTWIIWAFNVISFISILVLAGSGAGYGPLYAFGMNAILWFPLVILMISLIFAANKNNSFSLALYIPLLIFGIGFPLFSLIYLCVIGSSAKKPIAEQSRAQPEIFKRPINENVNDDVLKQNNNFVTPNDLTVKLQKLESLKNKGLIDLEDYRKLKEDIIKSNL